jgi:hypothetical protein
MIRSLGGRTVLAHAAPPVAIPKPKAGADLPELGPGLLGFRESFDEADSTTIGPDMTWQVSPSTAQSSASQGGNSFAISCVPKVVSDVLTGAPSIATTGSPGTIPPQAGVVGFYILSDDDMARGTKQFAQVDAVSSIGASGVQIAVSCTTGGGSLAFAIYNNGGGWHAGIVIDNVSNLIDPTTLGTVYGLVSASAFTSGTLRIERDGVNIVGMVDGTVITTADLTGHTGSLGGFQAAVSGVIYSTDIYNHYNDIASVTFDNFLAGELP